MYAALWRVLPGPWWVRTIILVIAAAAVIAALIFFVFPAVQPFFLPTDSVVGGG